MCPSVAIWVCKYLVVAIYSMLAVYSQPKMLLPNLMHVELVSSHTDINLLGYGNHEFY